MASQVFITVGTTQWTWPAGATNVMVECLGGGGAGGNATGNPSSGGGGKGGGYGKQLINRTSETYLDVTVGGPGQSSYVTKPGVGVQVRGAGGGGGSSASVNSTNGAGSTVEMDGGNLGGYGTFAGGNGGTGNFTSGVQGSGAGGGAGGATGAGGNGSVNAGGIAGTGAWGNGTTYQAAGRNGSGDSTAGLAGLVYGGGGSGGKANANADRLGGAGSQGVVVLTWTIQLAKGVTSGEFGSAFGEVGSISYAFSPPPALYNGMVMILTFYELSGGSADFTTATVYDDSGNTWTRVTQAKCVGFGGAPDNGPDNPKSATAVYYCPRLMAVGNPHVVRASFAGKYGWWNASCFELTGLQGPLHVSAYASTVSQSQYPTTQTITAPAQTCTVATFVRAWSVVTLTNFLPTLWLAEWSKGWSDGPTAGRQAAGADVRFDSGVSGANIEDTWDTQTTPYFTNAMVIVNFDAPPPAPTAVTGVTLARTSVVNVPSVAPGAVTITGVTRATTASLFVPTVALAAQVIALQTLASAAVLSQPSIAATVSGATLAATSATTSPSVVPGAVAISGATIAAASAVQIPTVAPGAVTISGAMIAASALARVPSVAPGPVPASGATIVSGSLLSPPAVLPGLVTVSGSTIGSTVTLFVLALGQTLTATSTTFVWLL